MGSPLACLALTATRLWRPQTPHAVGGDLVCSPGARRLAGRLGHHRTPTKRVPVGDETTGQLATGSREQGAEHIAPGLDQLCSAQAEPTIVSANASYSPTCELAKQLKL
jgi:hypothetical protein